MFPYSALFGTTVDTCLRQLSGYVVRWCSKLWLSRSCISSNVIPLRTLVPEPQMADQLLEVPTIISYPSLQRTVEQHVDIPVPGSGGPSSGLQGFLPRQSSTVTPSVERISERTLEQIIDISSPGDGLGRGSASSAGPADEDFTGGFRTLPHGKSAEYRAGGECAAWWARQFIHAERSSMPHAGDASHSPLLLEQTHT